MLKKIFLTVVAAASFAGLSHAADAINTVPEAPVAAATVAPFSWGGVYGGASAGYGWGKLKLDDGFDTFSADFDGGRFSGFVGYNFEVAPSVILGAEGDLGYSWAKETVDGDEAKAGFNGSARLRAGYAIDHALIYAAGGYTAAKGKLTGDSETFNGWTIGAGVDYAITNNVFARVEYRYNDFGSKTFSDGADSLRLDAKEHVVNVGLGVKF